MSRPAGSRRVLGSCAGADDDDLEGSANHPWFPLAAGKLAGPVAVLTRIASGLDAGNGQLARAWLLRRSPVMLPIPVTSSVEHLRDNVSAAALNLTDEDFAALEAAAN